MGKSFLYKDGESKLFPEVEINQALNDGWTDNPAGKPPQEPRPEYPEEVVVLQDMLEKSQATVAQQLVDIGQLQQELVMEKEARKGKRGK